MYTQPYQNVSRRSGGRSKQLRWLEPFLMHSLASGRAFVRPDPIVTLQPEGHVQCSYSALLCVKCLLTDPIAHYESLAEAIPLQGPLIAALPGLSPTTTCLSC